MRALAAALLIVALGCTPASAPPNVPNQPTGVPSRPSPDARTLGPTATLLPGSRMAAIAGIVESRSDLPRNRADAASEDDLATMVAADRDFAIDLYRTLIATEDGNVFISPYSISTAMSMVLAGARGQTAEELATALRVGDDHDAWHLARNRLESELAALAEWEPPGEGDAVPLTLETVNAIFGQRGFPFERDYLDVLAANYGAGMNAVDFATQWEAARAAINEWVAARTNERIEELLPEGSIYDLTRAVLVNAIFFKANWVHQFDPELTQDGAFRLLDGSDVQVPLMHDRNKRQYAAGDGWQAVELPYHGGASMLLIVPDENRFAEIEAGVDAEFLAGVNAQLSEHDVELRLPRWESESDLDLIPALESLGVVLLFDRHRADLTGVADVERNLFVSGVFHDAFISVDEEGTEAAAATAAVISLESGAPPAEVTVDRPFIYLIRDEANGEILFMGRLLEP